MLNISTLLHMYPKKLCGDARLLEYLSELATAFRVDSSSKLACQHYFAKRLDKSIMLQIICQASLKFELLILPNIEVTGH